MATRLCSVGDRIQYVGPDIGQLRPGMIGRVVEITTRNEVIVRFSRERLTVKPADKRFQKLILH